MAKIRRAGFGTVFNIENEKVGIGTTGKFFTEVRVLKNLELSDANVVTQAQLENYQGFLSNETRLSGNDVDLNKLVGYVRGEAYYGESHVHNRDDGSVVNMVGSAHTTFSHNVIDDSSNIQSGAMGDIIIDGEFTVSSGTTYCSSVEQLTSVANFTVPTGNTDDRIHCHTAGSMRFNEDLGTLEFYTGDEWKTVNSFKDTGNRGRGVFGGGFAAPSNPANTSLMHMIEISTLGNSEFFGDLVQQRRNPGGRVSDGTRGLILGGYHEPAARDNIDYCTIASAGNFIDFGNLTAAKFAIASNGLSSSTRGIVAGGATPSSSNVIEYVEIQTIGNALDFGDLTATCQHGQAVNSSTKGLFCGSGPGLNTKISSITISSTGNAVDIGDLTVARYYGAGVSNGVRGVVGGGFIISPMASNGMGSSLEFVTFASDGNAVFFGDLTEARGKLASVETQTRGVFIGSDSGNPSTNTYTNVMDFINIASAGNAQDFGDATNNNNHQVAGFSDSHGGLGGF